MLDFERLFTRLECKEPGQKITVLLYSLKDGKYVLHSAGDQAVHIGHLEEGHAGDKVGACLFGKGCILVSIGASEKDKVVLRANVRKAMGSVHALLPDGCEVCFAETPYAEDAVYGFVVSSYAYDFLKMKKQEKRCLLSAPGYEATIALANAQNFARFLGDTPANMMTPTLFTEYVKRFIAQESIEVAVHDRAYMEEKGMGLVLSVSQGSAQEPRLLHLRYLGRGGKGVDVALVGKGVTFDTGGTSIKPAAGMASMKNDMLGAATLAATLKLAAARGLPMNITGTFPLVENMPGSRATKPGDVFASMAGKTVEVDNTDAEGRLILADALTFAQQDDPEYLFDAATLTGAMVVSLGSVYGGFFTNDDALATLIHDAGVHTNDLLWRMPLSVFYRRALKSQVADLNNMGGRDAGSAKAAEFLHEFVDEGRKWAHFDIAGLSDKSFDSELYGEGATGRPVPAFLEILERLSRK